MAYTDRTIIDQIEITKTGAVQVRKAIQIVNDAGLETETVASETYWRGAVEPGDVVAANDMLGNMAPVALSAWQTMGIAFIS